MTESHEKPLPLVGAPCHAIRQCVLILLLAGVTSSVAAADWIGYWDMEDPALTSLVGPGGPFTSACPGYPGYALAEMDTATPIQGVRSLRIDPGVTEARYCQWSPISFGTITFGGIFSQGTLEIGPQLAGDPVTGEPAVRVGAFSTSSYVRINGTPYVFLPGIPELATGNAWVVWVLNPTSRLVKRYVNGSYRDSVTVPAGVTPATIGCMGFFGGPGQVLQRCDNIFLFNGALLDEQIQQLAVGVKPPMPIQAKPADGPQDDDCSGCTQPLLGATTFSMKAPPAVTQFGGDPIRYADGEMQMWEDDLEPLASGSLSYRRSYSNLLSQQSGYLGVGWLSGAQPRLYLVDNMIVLRRRAETQVTFVIQGADYVRLRPGYSKLVSGQNGTLVYMDDFGGMSVFQGFADAVPVAQRGQIIRQYNQAGMLIATNYQPDGRLAETRRIVAEGRHEILTYGYGANGMVSRVERRQAIPGGTTSTLIQAVDYTYYTGAAGDFGGANQMRSAVISDGAGQTLRQFHYRYYRSGESLGFPTGLKLAIGPRNYARLVQANQNPLTMSTGLLTGTGTHANKVDKYFEYDLAGRVTKQVLKTPDIDGSGTFTYAYTARTSPPVTPLSNDWLMRTIETNPDSSQNIVYTNKNGDILVKARRATETAATSTWLVDAYRYDADWRMTWHITPSAMVMDANGKWYNDAVGSDLGINAADSVFVNNSAGLIERWTYHPSGVPEAGRLQSDQQQVGEQGSQIVLKSYTYLGHANK